VEILLPTNGAVYAPGSDILWRMTMPISVQDVPDMRNVDRLIFNWNRKNVGDDEAQWWPNTPGVTVQDGEVRSEMNPAEYQQFLKRRGQVFLRLVGALDRQLNYTDPGRVDIVLVRDMMEAATAQARSEFLSGRMADGNYAAEVGEKVKAYWSK
jgi:hypothetical protein